MRRGYLGMLAAGLLASGSALAAADMLTAQNLNDFVANYHLQPRPELVSAAIALLPGSGLENNPSTTGWFAEVFAANSDRQPEWRALASKQKGSAGRLLKQALNMQAQGGVQKLSGKQVEHVAMWTGAYSASGDPVHVQRLIGQLRDWDNIFGAFDSARSSGIALAYMVRQDPLVRELLEQARQGAAPRPAQILTDVLAGDPVALRLQTERDLAAGLQARGLR